MTTIPKWNYHLFMFYFFKWNWFMLCQECALLGKLPALWILLYVCVYREKCHTQAWVCIKVILSARNYRSKYIFNVDRLRTNFIRWSKESSFTEITVLLRTLAQTNLLNVMIRGANAYVISFRLLIFVSGNFFLGLKFKDWFAAVLYVLLFWISSFSFSYVWQSSSSINCPL